MSSTEEQKRERTGLAGINGLIKTSASGLDLRQVYDSFASQLKRLIAFDRASVALIKGDELQIFALSSEIESQIGQRVVVALRGTATQWVAANKKAYIT